IRAAAPDPAYELRMVDKGIAVSQKTVDGVVAGDLSGVGGVGEVPLHKIRGHVNVLLGKGIVVSGVEIQQGTRNVALGLVAGFKHSVSGRAQSAVALPGSVFIIDGRGGVV